MKIQTKYFGEQEISASDIISFPSGLPGFNEIKQFVLLPFGEVFYILQSVDEKNVAFVVTSPFSFFSTFMVDLPDTLVKQLSIESDKDVSVQVIVSVKNPFSQSTANLKAPLIINTVRKLGKQYIPEASSYSLSEPLVQTKNQKGA